MKVCAIFLVALAAATANFLQETEQEVSAVFDQLKASEDRRAIISRWPAEVLKGATACLVNPKCPAAVKSVAEAILRGEIQPSDFGIAKARQLLASGRKRAVICKWPDTTLAAARVCVRQPRCGDKAVATAMLDGTLQPPGCGGKRMLASEEKRAVICKWDAGTLAAARACVRQPGCAAIDKPTAKAILDGTLQSPGCGGKRMLVSDYKASEEKRAVNCKWPASALDAARACLANPSCPRAYKAAAKSVLAGTLLPPGCDGKRMLVSVSTVEKLFASEDKRAVISTWPAIALSAARNCLANPRCPPLHKALSAAILNGSLQPSDIIGNDVYKSLVSGGKRDVICKWPDTTLAAARRCVANSRCAPTAKVAAKAMLDGTIQPSNCGGK